MSYTDVAVVPNAKKLDPLFIIAGQAAGLWASQVLIGGTAYHRHESAAHKRSREMLRQAIAKFIHGRLVLMTESHDSGEQWLINHLPEVYPPFKRALKECMISGASWPFQASMSIIYRNGAFDVRSRFLDEDCVAVRHWHFQVNFS